MCIRMEKKGRFDILKLLKSGAVLLLLAALFAGCGHKAGDSNGGGVIDSGGGDFQFADHDEVIQSTNKVWQELTSSRSPIFVAYEKLENTKDKTGEQAYIFAMLRKILWGEQQPPKDFQMSANGEFPETRLNQLSSKSIHFEENEFCQAGQAHKMASVSRFDFSGDVCVSIRAMKISPTSSSKFDIMALLVHEIAHLAGYKSEVDANRIQRFFLKHAAVFYKMDGMTAKGMIAGEVSYLARTWYDCILSYADPIDTDYMTAVKERKAYLNRLMILLPDAALNEELHIAHPELYGATKQKFQDALDKIMDFQLHWMGCDCTHATGKEAFAKGKLSNFEQKPQPWNMQLLNDIRAMLLAQLDLESAIDKYLFGDEVPTKSGLRTSMDIEADRALIIKQTQPEVLEHEMKVKDSKTRLMPSHEMRDRLNKVKENESPFHDQEGLVRDI